MLGALSVVLCTPQQELCVYSCALLFCSMFRYISVNHLDMKLQSWCTQSAQCRITGVPLSCCSCCKSYRWCSSNYCYYCWVTAWWAAPAVLFTVKYYMDCLLCCLFGSLHYIVMRSYSCDMTLNCCCILYFLIVLRHVFHLTCMQQSQQLRLPKVISARQHTAYA